MAHSFDSASKYGNLKVYIPSIAQGDRAKQLRLAKRKLKTKWDEKLRSILLKKE